MILDSTILYSITKVAFIVALVLVLVFFAYLIFTLRYMLVSVEGESMLPTLREGDILLLKKNPKSIKEGKIYVYASPTSDIQERLVIKRLKEAKGNYLYFLGDNPSKSQDSRHYGYIPRSKILAQLIYIKRKS